MNIGIFSSIAKMTWVAGNMFKSNDCPGTLANPLTLAAIIILVMVLTVMLLYDPSDKNAGHWATQLTKTTVYFGIGVVLLLFIHDSTLIKYYKKKEGAAEVNALFDNVQFGHSITPSKVGSNEVVARSEEIDLDKELADLGF